eukprot:1188-Heterococcus_DN1.PRE.2
MHDVEADWAPLLHYTCSSIHGTIADAGADTQCNHAPDAHTTIAVSDATARVSTVRCAHLLTNGRPTSSSNVYTRCRKFMPNRTSYDHACVSAYNWGDDKSGGYKAFEEVFTFAYNNLANVTDVPLGLCEGSTVGAGGNKTQWYMDAVDTLKTLPRVTQAHWCSAGELLQRLRDIVALEYDATTHCAGWEDRPYDFDCNEGCLGLGAAIDALKFTAARTAAPTIATHHSTTQPTGQPTLAVAATGTAAPTVASIDPTTVQPTGQPTTAVAAAGTAEPTVATDQTTVQPTVQTTTAVAATGTAAPTIATDQTTIQPTVASPIAGLFPMPVGTLAPTAPSTSSGFV